MKHVYIAKTASETEKVGEKISEELKPNDVVCLYGELGAGKTTITRGIAKGLGITGRVLSPSFSLVNIHTLPDKGPINTLYHLDLYRLEDIEEVKSIGIEEILADPYGVTLIEWAEKMKMYLPEKRIEILLSHVEKDSRKIEVITY